MEKHKVMLFSFDSKKEIPLMIQVDTPEIVDGFVMRGELSGKQIVASEYYYFSTFQAFRDQLLCLGYGMKCNGSRLNAINAKEHEFDDKINLLRMGEGTKTKVLVSLWDYADINEYPSTEEQSKFLQQRNANNTYIATLQINDVPWSRLTTAYGRATDFPALFRVIWDMKDKESVVNALSKIIANAEHQGTLWHASPFIMIFLDRIYKNVISEMKTNEIAKYIFNQLMNFFVVVSKCCQDIEKMEHAKELPFFSDLLKEEYLWSDEYDEEEDALRYEDENAFSPELWYSFYFYSYLALSDWKTMIEKEKYAGDF